MNLVESYCIVSAALFYVRPIEGAQNLGANEYSNSNNQMSIAQLESLMDEDDFYQYDSGGQTLSALNGLQIPVAYVTLGSDPEPNEILPKTNSGESTLQLLGHHIDNQILAYVQDVLNFTAIFHRSSNYAYLHPNNTWGGMAGLVEQHQVDFAADSVYVLSNRVRNFRFLAVGYHNKLSAFFQTPSRTSDGYKDVFLTCFRYVYLPILSLATFLVFLLIIVYNVKFSSAVLTIISYIAHQGLSHRDGYGTQILRHDYFRSTESYKILAFVIGVCFFIVHAYIGASLISKFSIQYKTISNLQDLIDEGYTFGVLNDSYLIKTSSDDDTTKNVALSKIMSNSPSLENFVSATEKLLSNKKFVLLTELDFRAGFSNIATSASTNSHLDFCDVLREIRLEEEPIRANGFVRKGSNISSSINSAMIKMWTSGNTKRFWTMQEEMTSDSNPTCINPTDESIHKEQLKIPYLIIFVGLILSVTLCLVEFIINTNRMDSRLVEVIP